jgi:hypothetical protein
MAKNMVTAKSSRTAVVCSACGSDDVVVDACAQWDFANQQWHLAEVFESTAICNNCGGECSIKNEMLT